MGIVNKVKILGKIKTLGFGFVFETVFEQIIPAWMCRFCSLAVYQIDLDQLPSDPFSSAAVKVCDSVQELEQLAEITSEYTQQKNSIGVLAKMDGQVAGGIWIAIGDYQDRDLGLSFLLGTEGTWLYSSRVDAAYRRRGIYSHLLAETALTRKSTGHTAPFLGVSKLNRGSHKAIQRFCTPVDEVLVIRLGAIVWARSKGGLKQNQTLTLRCTRRPIQFNVPEAG